MYRLLLALCLILPAWGPALADPPSLPRGEPMAAWPDADYDPAIPALESVTGFALGEALVDHRDMLAYLEALEAAAPERLRVVRIGQSWQGRDLVLAVITSERNMARLDEIQAGMQRLGDPRQTDRAAAQRLIDDLPAPVWLAYAVHGDEISTTDAALYVAYHLLAARGDDRVTQILDETVVILNPLQNPDGRERFIASTVAARGLEADDDPGSAERDQPWPGGRFNHYVFDLNRDWFAQTQPETRAHTRAMLEWLPVVVADVHEMGTDQTYFFPPAAAPTNPLLTPAQARLREAIGRNNAEWFDRFGIEYFTREIFDLFYPGYGDGWPHHFGAAGMTYEQGSARGLVARRSNGERLSFADTIWNQSVASLATIETVARERARWLNDFYDYQVSAIDTGRRAAEGRYALLPTQRDQAGADRLARLLASQRVDVSRADADFRACTTDYARGSYIIDLAQPASRLVRVLLDRQIDIESDFMAEQKRRRERGLPDEIYDVTAWSLPLMRNLEVERCNALPRVSLTAVDADPPQRGSVDNTGARVAFLVAWGEREAAAFLSRALRSGLTVQSADEAFETAGRRWPGGSLVIPRAGNPDDLVSLLETLAQHTGVQIVGVDDSWITEGPNFGSAKMPRLRAPRVALLWDRPTSPTGAGATRFILERHFDLPVTVLRGHTFAGRALDRFDVIILPQGGDYAGVLGGGAAEELRDWVRRGGVLIGLGGAVGYLAEPAHGLMSLRREDAWREEPTDAADDEKDAPRSLPGTRIADAAAYLAAIQPPQAPPDTVAGALLRADVDAEHWLTAGAAESVYVLYQGTAIYSPLRLDQGVNAVSFAAAEGLVASGAVWPENRDQLAFKPVIALEPLGRGYMIAFTTDPTWRAMHDGLEVLLANAVLRAPARTRPRR